MKWYWIQIQSKLKSFDKFYLISVEIVVENQNQN